MHLTKHIANISKLFDFQVNHLVNIIKVENRLSSYNDSLSPIKCLSNSLSRASLISFIESFISIDRLFIARRIPSIYLGIVIEFIQLELTADFLVFFRSNLSLFISSVLVSGLIFSVDLKVSYIADKNRAL